MEWDFDFFRALVGLAAATKDRKPALDFILTVLESSGKTVIDTACIEQACAILLKRTRKLENATSEPALNTEDEGPDTVVYTGEERSATAIGPSSSSASRLGKRCASPGTTILSVRKRSRRNTNAPEGVSATVKPSYEELEKLYQESQTLTQELLEGRSAFCGSCGAARQPQSSRRGTHANPSQHTLLALPKYSKDYTKAELAEFLDTCRIPLQQEAASAREKQPVAEEKRKVRRDRLEVAMQRQKLKRLEKEDIKKRKRQEKKDRRRWEQRIEEVDSRLKYERGVDAEINGNSKLIWLPISLS